MSLLFCCAIAKGLFDFVAFVVSHARGLFRTVLGSRAFWIKGGAIHTMPCSKILLLASHVRHDQKPTRLRMHHLRLATPGRRANNMWSTRLGPRYVIDFVVRIRAASWILLYGQTASSYEHFILKIETWPHTASAWAQTCGTTPSALLTGRHTFLVLLSRLKDELAAYRTGKRVV